MSRVNDLIAMTKDRAKHIIEVHGQEHIPMLLIDCPEGVSIIGFADMNDQVKEMFSKIVSRLLRQHKATAYVWVCEGWAAEDEAADKIYKQGGRISDLPLDDRSEILQMVVCEKGQPPWMIHAKIHNTPQGRKVGDYEELKPPEGSIEGRMVVTNW